MSKALKENYIIRIKSQIEQDGETEQVELMTRGSFTMREGSYYITYRETETTGYEGCVTTLKLAADSSRVAMLRFGPQSSQLIIEKGRRNLCHYALPPNKKHPKIKVLSIAPILAETVLRIYNDWSVSQLFDTHK